jgi:Nif-specific regulatory protein
VLSNDAGGDTGLCASAGVREALVRSVLCAPLVVGDRPIGALYLATRNPRAPFDEPHLHLVTAAAGIVALALSNARHGASLESETHRLREDLDLEHRMVGECEAAQAVYRFVAKVGPTEATVLISGESGTGKELVARAIHRGSPRRARPFVAINCAAIAESLLESELFGHERGAFTGAVAQKRGKIETAEGGTLFLDEVCELAPMLQAKLLRVLQERQFERVGGTRPIGVDLRIIAATNSDVSQALGDGRLREDLYYRLNVVSITLPPLRKRRDDIPLLASFFVERYASRCKRPVYGVSAPARELLQRYDWPGNVRELENTIERAIVLGTTDEVLPEDLPDSVLDAAASAEGQEGGYHAAIARAKKALILDALERTHGNYTEAAHCLGLYPTSLHRLVRQLGIRDELKRH